MMLNPFRRARPYTGSSQQYLSAIFGSVLNGFFKSHSGKFVLPSLTGDTAQFVSNLQSIRVNMVDRVVGTIPIQVRVARGGANRVFLQPSARAGVVFPCAHVIQTDGGRPFIPIRAVPAEGVEGGTDLLDGVAPGVAGVAVGDVALTVKEQTGVPACVE